MQLDVQDNNANPLKIIDILEALAQLPDGAGISQLHTATGLSKSTLHRLLAALVERQYVVKDENSKQYRLGFKILSLSSSILDSIEIRKLARDEMLRLADVSRETIHLICLDGQEGVYVDKVDTPNSIGLMSRIGKRLPLYCTSGGKALLAYQSTDWLEHYLSSVVMVKYTATTIETPRQLAEELEQVRKQGFALDQAEHHENITCIAVPILRSGSQVVASMSIAAPSYRFSVQKALTFQEALIESSMRISQKLSL